MVIRIHERENHSPNRLMKEFNYKRYVATQQCKVVVQAKKEMHG
jgi:hypothetical protein